MVGGRSLHQTYTRPGRGVKVCDQQNTSTNGPNNNNVQSKSKSTSNRLNISIVDGKLSNSFTSNAANSGPNIAIKSGCDNNATKISTTSSTSLQRNKQQQSNLANKWPSSSSSCSSRNHSPISSASNSNHVQSTTTQTSSQSSPSSGTVLESNKRGLNMVKNSKNQAQSSPSLNINNNNNNNTNLTGLVNPEIYFLIKEHAKTLAAIDKITRRLSDLEVRVDDILTKLLQIEESNKINSNAKENKINSKRPDLSGNQVVSDDSGGEYSRTTVGTGIDDDELLSLLNYIGKISDTIKAQKSCLHSVQQPSSSSSSTSPLRKTVQPYIPEIALNYQQPYPNHHHHHHHHRYNQQSSPALWATSKIGSNSNLNGVHQMTSPLISDSNRLLNEPASSSSSHPPHSFSALLFESNVDRFLDNLDLIAEPKRYFPSSHSHPLHHQASSRRLLSDMVTLPMMEQTVSSNDRLISSSNFNHKQPKERNYYEPKSTNQINRNNNHENHNDDDNDEDDDDDFVSLDHNNGDHNKANWPPSKTCKNNNSLKETINNKL